MTRKRPARPKAKPPKPGDQLDIDQRCVACRTGGHRACTSKTCPCAERGHQ